MSVLLALAAPPVLGQKEGVWFWFSNCGPRQLALEVTFDGASLYRSTIPICKADRKSAASQGESKAISLLMRPNRAIKWEGYRADKPTTPAGYPLTVDLWEAGADPDDLLIGVSVSDKQQIYMNTIYIAFPDRPSSTEIETGLVVSTQPVSGGK